MDKKITIIATVKNEADNIEALIESMLSQTLKPDEIVINDNHSSDDTLRILLDCRQTDKKIRVVQGDGNIAQGRNRAIRESTGQIIACCDGGTRLSNRWLEAITADLVSGRADIVGGYSASCPQTFWELVLGVVTLPDPAEINESTYLPGGRSMAFTRKAWEQAGGFPEWADVCEDLLFDRTLQGKGMRFAFAPDAVVCFRPRRTPHDHFVQYLSYAHGDAVANLWVWRHLIRYTAYSVFGLFILLIAVTRSPMPLLIMLPGVLIHTQLPYRRLQKRFNVLSCQQKLSALVLIPFVRLLGDAAKMIGYLIGLYHSARTRTGY